MEIARNVFAVVGVLAVILVVVVAMFEIRHRLRRRR